MYPSPLIPLPSPTPHPLLPLSLPISSPSLPLSLSPTADTESIEEQSVEMECEQQNDSAYDSFIAGRLLSSLTSHMLM